MIEKQGLAPIVLVVEWSLARCCKSVSLGSIPAHDVNPFRLCHDEELIID